MKLQIRTIEVELPRHQVTNLDLQELHPEWDMSSVEARAGVKTRYFAQDGETALDLAERACRSLQNGDEPSSDLALVDTVIFCTQTADYLLPANACLLQNRLDLAESVFAFDLFMGCSGFINGLALAQGLIHSGQSRNTLLVTADTLSKRINPGDRSVGVLFGDGAAVTWLSGARSGEGLIDIECSTAGRYYDKIIIPAGGCRTPYGKDSGTTEPDANGNVRTPGDVHMDGLAVLGLVNSRVPVQIRQVLDRNSLSIADIDFFLFHQASKVALDSLGRILDIPPEKTHRNLESVGNTVSASIPIVLKDAWDRGLVKRGDLLLLSGFGVGLAWGTAIVRL